MKFAHSVIGFASIVLGVTFSYSVRALTQPLSTIPFLPLDINKVIYNDKEYKSDLLYTNVGGEGWLASPPGSPAPSATVGGLGYRYYHMVYNKNGCTKRLLPESGAATR